MKARTKLQLRVKSLSERLPRITKAQELWAKTNCLKHKGYATKTRVICLDCGESFPPVLVNRKRAVCPHCETKIIVEQSKKRTDKQISYFGIADVIEDFQVISFYEQIACYKSGEAMKYYCHEIMEHWILPDGNREVIGKNHSLHWFMDTWNGDWEIRDKTNERKYDVYPHSYHPDSVFKVEYQKFGIDKNLDGMSFLDAIRIIPYYPHAETLLKAKQYRFLSVYNTNNRDDAERYWSSIKICLRNKYKVSDLNTWFDYLDLLSYFGKDLHNAKYICPRKLKAEHDRLVRIKRERQQREELEREKADKEQMLASFAEKVKAFMGFQFTDGKIIVKVLETIEEFKQEGDILKHCVFTNEYFGKPDSLILSARIDGIPIETIEVSLSKMKITQSRGLENEPTVHNKRIVGLVRKNLNKIKKIAHQMSA